MLRTLTPALSHSGDAETLTPALSHCGDARTLTPALSHSGAARTLTPALSQGERGSAGSSATRLGIFRIAFMSLDR